jgi:Tol biopolymer transport system component
VRPGVLNIWVMDADGSNKRQLTDFEGASFAPYFHPSSEQIIFASNLHEPTGRNFDLYLINIDGTGLERVTTFDDFDSFPMFSPDGSKLVFGSNRHQREAGSTNVFIADWVDDPDSQ